MGGKHGMNGKSLFELMGGPERERENAELLRIWGDALAKGGDTPRLVFRMIGQELRARNLIRPVDIDPSWNYSPHRWSRT
ncbi:hypothetical protein [Deinococcus peraridilitoris]|uniref:Uncharacterized protein n=1 Tax=Deinococcus peraridilitoris (strain DSM 19664 / LMG 22246 / CIP 109416 / KR-200) TaxID=937777 RepID=K9ZZL6_DEIPD|nr:hypothetical protein [Deinococcus peraridilitoris]AFZ67046.1 hypothetical protein Deipe_1505 [Deinococcus peraridilitoris DSM 19664]